MKTLLPAIVFSLWVAAPAASQVPIECGQTVTGSIAVSGQQQVYTFPGNAGEAVTIAAVATAGSLSARVELRGPTDALIGSNGFGNRGTGPIALKATGTYRIILRDYAGTNTGGYELTLQFVTGRCATASIDCGQTRTGVLAARTAHHLYTFSGSANDAIFITSLTTAGTGSAVAELYGPTGAFLGGNVFGNRRTGVLILPATGTYSILVHDYSLANTGPYELNLQFVTGRCPTGPLTCGQTRAGSIATRTQHDVYTFAANANEAVVISSMRATGGAPVAELFGPTGAFLGGNVFGNRASGVLRLPVTGTYAIVVHDYSLAASGGYDVSLQFVTGRCATAIACGGTSAGALTRRSQLDAYTFTGTAGESVILTSLMTTPGPGSAASSLYGPTGTLIGSNVFGNRSSAPLRLPVTGAYTILVYDYSLISLGGYSVGLSCGTTTCSYAVVPTAQTFGPGPGSAMGRASVVAPAGCPWKANTNVTWAAISSGHSGTGNGVVGYTVAPNVGAPTRSGTLTIAGQTFTIGQAGDVGTPLSCNQPVSDTIATSGEIDSYTVAGLAQTEVAITATRTSGAMCLRGELYGPDGRLIGINSCTSPTLRATLPLDGAYRLLLFDAGLNETGTYDLSWQLASGGCVIPLQITSVSAMRGGNAGQASLAIRGTGFQPGASVRLMNGATVVRVGQNTTVQAHSRIATTFDLRGEPARNLTLQVLNPDGSTASPAAPFVVEEGGRAAPWVSINGPAAIRAGRPASFSITYGNRGNIDAHVVPLWIAGIPREATVTLGVRILPPPTPPGVPTLPPIAWNDIPIRIDHPDQSAIPLLLPFLPPESAVTVTMKVMDPTPGPIELRAWVHRPLVSGPSSNFDAIACLLAIANEALNIAGIVVPGVDCAEVFADWAAAIFVQIAQDGYDAWRNNFTDVDGAFSITQIIADLGALIAQCAGREAAGTFFGAISAVLGLRDVDQNCFGGKVWEAIKQFLVTAAIDPNEKHGPQGTGTSRYLRGQEAIDYRVLFENLPAATAPALEVVVTDQIDIAALDVTTFTLGEMEFGEHRITPPPGLSSYITAVDLRPASNMIVRVQASLNTMTGIATWRFSGVDPITGEAPEDPLAGFLPPNATSPEGEGSVRFSIAPRAPLVTGTTIRNHASIVFDANPAIVTPEWVNTLDVDAPESRVAPLDAVQGRTGIRVAWSGTDFGAGVHGYTVAVSTNGSPFVIWQETTATTAVFPGELGAQYAFHVVARDHAGNLEPAKTAAEATTRVAENAVLDGDADGMTDEWELEYGLDPRSDAGEHGAAGDPDGDGVANADEHATLTDPTLANVVTLAEGATGSFFTERIALVNPGTIPARVTVSFLQPDAAPLERTYDIAPRQRITIEVNDVPGLESADVSAVVRTTQGGVVVERTMMWDRTSLYGGHTAKAVRAPRDRWYLAEGEANFFDTFLLFTNANSETAAATATYLMDGGATVTRTYEIAANSRRTVRTNDDPELSGRPFSTTVTSDVPITLDRAMYFSAAGRPYAGGHTSPAVEEPSRHWFVAEGATGEFFDEYLLLANPNASAAVATIRFLTVDGRVITRDYTLAPSSRTTVYVDAVEGLEQAPGVSAQIDATLPIIVERAMYWPRFPWYGAHNSAGVTAAGTRWVLAEGETGGALGFASYVLLANPRNQDATVTMTMLRTDRPPLVTSFTVPAYSRVTRGAHELELESGERFGVLVDSSSPIVVERAIYWNGGGVFWGAGTTETATRVR